MLYYVKGEEVNVIVAEDMPVGMPEHIWKNPDGSYTVRLNALYNIETLREALAHAFKHVIRGDFDKKDADVNVIEAETHEEGSDAFGNCEEVTIREL